MRCCECGINYVKNPHKEKFCEECIRKHSEDFLKRYYKEYYRNYAKSEKGKEMFKRYKQSDKGKTVSGKCTTKRRNLEFVPLNNYFGGSEAHHIDKAWVIYIPRELHRSISHNIWTGENMNMINDLAWKWFFENELYV